MERNLELYEKKILKDKEFPIQLLVNKWNSKGKYFGAHWHEQIELHYVVRGRTVIRLEQEEMDAGAGSPLQDQSDSLSAQKQEAAMMGSREEGSGNLSSEAAEGTVFEHGEIMVTEEENDFEKTDGSFPGTFYMVTVQRDAAGGLKEGQELVVELPAYYSFVLAKDSVYEVDLIFQEDGTYLLEGYHRQVGE